MRRTKFVCVSFIHLYSTKEHEFREDVRALLKKRRESLRVGGSPHTPRFFLFGFGREERKRSKGDGEKGGGGRTADETCRTTRRRLLLRSSCTAKTERGSTQPGSIEPIARRQKPFRGHTPNESADTLNGVAHNRTGVEEK